VPGNREMKGREIVLVPGNKERALNSYCFGIKYYWVFLGWESLDRRQTVLIFTDKAGSIPLSFEVEKR
jgi:hypothetical protein